MATKKIKKEIEPKPLSDEVVSKPKIKSDLRSDTINITVCVWNINGEASAVRRKAVTTTTFNTVDVPGASEPTKLCQSDIICLQEVTVHGTTDDDFRPSNSLKEYIPLAQDSNYGVLESKETQTYNMVLYNKEKFKLAVKDFNEAFKLTDGEDSSHRRTKTEALLNERMAIALLQHQDCYLIVISIHSFRHKAGAQERIRLLLTFLKNLKKTGTDYPVIITGDFNCDIRTGDSLHDYLEDYHVTEYALRPLRATVQTKDKCIDFIVVSKESTDWECVVPVVVTAHDMVVSSEIEVELKKNAIRKKQERERKKQQAADQRGGKQAADQKKRSECAPSTPPTGRGTGVSKAKPDVAVVPHATDEQRSRKARASSSSSRGPVAVGSSQARSTSEGASVCPAPSDEELHRTITNHSPLSTTLQLKRKMKCEISLKENAIRKKQERAAARRRKKQAADQRAADQREAADQKKQEGAADQRGKKQAADQKKRLECAPSTPPTGRGTGVSKAKPDVAVVPHATDEQRSRKARASSSSSRGPVAVGSSQARSTSEGASVCPAPSDEELHRTITNHSPLSTTLQLKRYKDEV